jgi:hypothetical protein
MGYFKKISGKKKGALSVICLVNECIYVCVCVILNEGFNY